MRMPSSSFLAAPSMLDIDIEWLLWNQKVVQFFRCDRLCCKQASNETVADFLSSWELCREMPKVGEIVECFCQTGVRQSWWLIRPWQALQPTQSSSLGTKNLNISKGFKISQPRREPRDCPWPVSSYGWFCHSLQDWGCNHPAESIVLHWCPGCQLDDLTFKSRPHILGP